MQRADNYQKVSEEYYANYQDAINREPTVVTERVLVRANCPPMPQPIRVEAWEMQQQQLTEPNYTQKLLEALQQ